MSCTLIFTVKSTLNCSCKLRPSKKKHIIRPRSVVAVCNVCSGSTLFGNYFIKSGTNKLQMVLKKKNTKKKTHTLTHKKKTKKKKTDAFKPCILYSLTVGIKATFDLLDVLTAPGVLQLQCIHMHHTNGLIGRLPSLMI